MIRGERVGFSTGKGTGRVDTLPDLVIPDNVVDAEFATILGTKGEIVAHVDRTTGVYAAQTLITLKDCR